MTDLQVSMQLSTFERRNQVRTITHRAIFEFLRHKPCAPLRTPVLSRYRTSNRTSISLAPPLTVTPSPQNQVPGSYWGYTVKPESSFTRKGVTTQQLVVGTSELKSVAEKLGGIVRKTRRISCLTRPMARCERRMCPFFVTFCPSYFLPGLTNLTVHPQLRGIDSFTHPNLRASISR